MVAPLQPWTWPAKPWQRFNIDFAGPFEGHMFLVIVDAHSHWPEVIEMKSTTTIATIRELRRLFASYGLPIQVVSDNGLSAEFKKFMKGIKHQMRAISNGAADRLVQSFKRAMKASGKSSQSFEQRLMNFLLMYRSTPHYTTNVAPCTLFLKRQVRTLLDLLCPSVKEEVVSKQADQKLQHDQHSKARELFLGQRVLVRNLRPDQTWNPGTVIEKNGPLSYLVQVSSDRVWKRHIDHIREMHDSPQVETPTMSSSDHGSKQTFPCLSPQVLSAESNFTEQASPTVTQQPTEATDPVVREETDTETVDTQNPEVPPIITTTEPPTTMGTPKKYPIRDQKKHHRFK